MNSVPKLFSCCYADCWTENHFSTEFGVLTPNRTHSHAFMGVRFKVVRESACMACKRSPVRSRYSPPKSTVLRRKYGAFLFAEADFWGLHCFACTVFRLLQAVPIQPPTFDFAPFSKRMFAARFFSRLLHHPPSIDAAKGGDLPQ